MNAMTMEQTGKIGWFLAWRIRRLEREIAWKKAALCGISGTADSAHPDRFQKEVEQLEAKMKALRG